MPEILKTPVEGTNHVTTKFQTTLSVQSYLIAFIVSDFTAAEDLSGVIPQRVFARKQLIDAGQAKLAIDVSRAILEGFEKYLGVNFSLPKMDQAGLSDFAAGAMENWVEHNDFHNSNRRFIQKISGSCDLSRTISVIQRGDRHCARPRKCYRDDFT
jgi:hypothetical protein